MQTFTIIKKNRKYFAGKTAKGYDFKLLIDENSESLEVGEHTLDLDDISVRTKYGTDLIFKLSAPAEEQKNAGICTITPTHYNSLMREEAIRLGGKWDAGAWVFSGLVSDQVEALDLKFNTLKTYKVTCLSELNAHTSALELFGVKLAEATGRDSGARTVSGLIVLTGGFTSTGSMKNWYTTARAGTVFIIDLPVELVETYDGDKLQFEAI